MRLLAWMTAAVFGSALVCASTVSAQQDQDSTKADSAHHKVEFENDQVRVVRFRLAPGEQSARHSHPDSVVIFLTDGSIQNTTDDGKVTSTKPKAGDTVWRPALVHITKNVGDQPIEGILVEPKNPHSARPVGSADEIMVPSARAKVVFENGQVRVLRYRFNPGERDEMHGHPDLVQILLTDATATITGPNGETNQFQGKAGQVNWRLAVVHSVQNTGGTSFEGALVEMKGEPKGSAS